MKLKIVASVAIIILMFILITAPAYALTKQIWAASVEAFPGETGDLSSSFSAASGPFGEEGDSDNWYFDDNGKIAVNEEYVGEYFVIEQVAATSGGITRRHIDVSSPHSHAYLFEDMTVVGKAEIRESFEMNNIAPGSSATSDWWDLF
ncbi:MAG: hypothetical protein SCJ97_00100 [Bacillota bacterium]|nr:hypothetical protein [Bacillota bacterium]